MTNAVIETLPSGHTNLTLHPNAKKAEDYAVEIASENTAYTKKEIRQHLQAQDKHEEGDYSVTVATAKKMEGRPDETGAR